MFKPILITRGIVIFPSISDKLDVGRTKSLASIKVANNSEDKRIVLVSQKDPALDDPQFEDLYQVGTLCEITKVIQAEDGSLKVNLKSLKRIKLLDIDEKDGALYANFEPLKDTNANSTEISEKIRNLFNAISSDTSDMSAEDSKKLKAIFNGTKAYSNSKIVDNVASYLPISINKKQQILEEVDLSKRLDIVLSCCINSDQMLKVDREINKRINDTLSKQQKEFYLREKMRVVKEELGEISSKENDVNNLKKRVLNNPYPQHIKDRVISELNRIEAGNNPQESAINRSYVEWLLDLPWWQLSIDNSDLKAVEKTLNESHYGLEKVKERIIEYLAVKTRSPNSKAPIICLVGPPGVGKSTLAYSIAKALNKKFVKMSLGGVRDEAEIRGHRKTYIGSMPGRVIKAMKQAGVVNPLFLLDELDKMTSDMRGDPASALLEVLDIEQNSKFSDNYIEEDYDLSKVMFVATANYPDQIPTPLYDRLEIIELTSYTEREKLEIAKQYLIPKILKDSCIDTKELKFTDEGILHMIRHYTREAGVRELERLIRKIARKYVVKQQHKNIKTELVDKAVVLEDLKKEIFEYNTKDEKPLPGVVNGMAYTSAGGDLLPIEATFFPGKGNIVITGNLKETMKESASVALGYVKANAKKFGITNIDFSKIDIHIHVPSGGIPKDGPSAGVTLTTAIISALSKRIVPNTIAMTGEITLRGKVLIIGGVKEKVISAFRGGVNEIFIPKNDERYLEDVPTEVRNKIKFHLIEHYEEIYKAIFTK